MSNKTSNADPNHSHCAGGEVEALIHTPHSQQSSSGMAKKRTLQEATGEGSSGEEGRKTNKVQEQGQRKKSRTGEGAAKSQKKGAPSPAPGPPVSAPPASTPETAAPVKKNKKPKHLKRKLEQALVDQDAGVIQEITLLQQELDSSKVEKAKKWKETCQKLAGPAWDEAKFDGLIGLGMDKKKLLEALGIESSDEKKKRLKSKSPKLNEKKKSFPQQRKGRGKPSPLRQRVRKGPRREVPGQPHLRVVSRRETEACQRDRLNNPTSPLSLSLCSSPNPTGCCPLLRWPPQSPPPL
jgi:hypothetical protein